MDDDWEHVTGDVTMLMLDDERLVVPCFVHGCPWGTLLETHWQPLLDIETVWEAVKPHMQTVHSEETCVGVKETVEMNRYVGGQIALMKVQTITNRDRRCYADVMVSCNEQSDGAVRFVLREAATAQQDVPHFDEWWNDLVSHVNRRHKMTWLNVFRRES